MDQCNYHFTVVQKKQFFCVFLSPGSFVNLIFCHLFNLTLSRDMIQPIFLSCMYQFTGYLHKSPSEMDNKLTSNRPDQRTGHNGASTTREQPLLIILPNNNHLFVHVHHSGVYANHPFQDPTRYPVGVSLLSAILFLRLICLGKTFPPQTTTIKAITVKIRDQQQHHRGS